MDYDPEDPLFSHEIQAYEKYLNIEPDFMAVEGYVHSDKARLRKTAVQMIAQHSKSTKFDAFIPYLAMNYFDRFVSRHEIPVVRGSVQEDLVLFALCCLTLAWKMRKNSFSVTKFLTERTINIDRRWIMKMELGILRGLGWRLRALTPLCFVEYFVPFFKLRDPLISEGFKRRSINEIIIQAQGDITFTKFRPSIIAASALLVASSVLYPARFPAFREKISSAPAVTEEALLECLEALDKLRREKKIVIERPGSESAKSSEPRGKEKKIVIEGPRSESAMASSSRAEQSEPREPEGSGEVPVAREGKAKVSEIEKVPREEESQARLMKREFDRVSPDDKEQTQIREGKAAVREIEEEPTEEENEAALTQFELDWVYPDDKDDPISFRFREGLSEATVGRIKCCCNPL